MIVLQTFISELENGLLDHMVASLWRVVASTALAIGLAAPAGLIMGQSKRVNAIFSPIVYLIYPIPKVVLVPVLLLIFGIGDLAKILIIFIILFFQILVLVRDQAGESAPRIDPKCAQPGSRTKGIVPLCVPARQLTRNFDRPAPISRNRCCSVIYRGVIRHAKRFGLLYLPQRQHVI